VEFRFREKLSFADFATARKHIDPDYVNVDTRYSARAQLDLANKTTDFVQKEIGYELSSLDRSRVLNFNVEHVLFSQLAPYPGWDEFIRRVKRDWEWFRKRVGIHPVSRVGVRYINRIDVPEQRIRPDDYLSVTPRIPDVLGGAVEAYSMQVEVPLAKEGKRRIKLTTGTVARNVVPGSVGLLLDIDVIDLDGLPTKTDDGWALLEELRKAKNHIFEASVTDAARKLFG
jgi:uncharacterized protein (TIGR04255 family)